MTTHRIALISDIHGNEIALRAVLADIDRVGVDQTVCLGDVATLGPRPQQVLAMLRERCSAIILGNHDEYLFQPDAIGAHTEDAAVVAAVARCRAELNADEIAFAKSFVTRLDVPLGRNANLLLFHGSPDSNNYDLLAETPDAQLSELLAPHRATVMAGGHTHVQMLRQHRGTLLVNPGSVGLPFERYVAGGPPRIMAHAEYAIVEAQGANIGVSLRRVSLDRAALADAAATWDSPLAAYLVAQYRG